MCCRMEGEHKVGVRLYNFPRQVRGRPSKRVDWLLYFELRSFAAFNSTDKIIYYVSEG
jgi:hypothetical protein